MRTRIRTDMNALRPAAVAVLALGLVLPTSLAAQDIRFDPRPDRPEERRLETFLEGDFVLIQTDTVLGPETRIEGNLLVLEADVRISGTITGDVAAVGADLFLRPGASIEGGILSLGGGLYASSRAEVEGDVTWRPNEVYLLRRDAETIRILPVRDVPETVTLHGLSGILFPGYQRVDEWTLGLGATVRHVEWDWQPSLEARVRLKTERGDLEGTLRHAWVPTSALQFGVEAERTTRTNEGWVRGEVANSLSYFFAGDDFRNYYEADRVALFLRGTETARLSPIVELEWEKARSLEAEDQFVLFASDDAVPNPAIDAGEIVSARLGLEYRRRTVETKLRTMAIVEAADSSAAGDFSYVFGEVNASWAGPALIGHGVEGFFMLRGDLSGELPRQRWTSVGGLATLPRLPLLSERGARFAYGQVTYLIPVDRLRVGLLGPPRLFLRAATGAAWNSGESAGFETNLSAGVRLFVFELAVAADPGASDLDPAVYATLRFPGDL
ncbi:MAG TPA: polymer-forming cytoskeletal protein [Gemmatimonadota bacterium]|nr:polymer-forming cytoskeletal protein [Gemmatimonadota bacterium]